jgi:hypothetical protein
MKSTLLIIALALASAVNAQVLNDILDGFYVPSKSSELSTPLLLTMSPQNGTPHEVLVLLITNGNPDGGTGNEFDPGEDAQIFGGDVLRLPIFEKGVYTICCLDEDGNNVGEQVSIFVNDNFVQGILETGYAEKRNSLIVSTRPLRIGRDNPEFVSFN